MQISSKSPSI